MMLATLSLGGCASEDDSAPTIEQKKSADAEAPMTASSAQREMYLPLLRKYHDQLSWPEGRDVTADALWEATAPTAGELILDDNGAKGDVGFANLCAWALTALDTVKRSGDVAEVLRGLVQSQPLMPGGESMSQDMADELVVGSVEKAQQFVTANSCQTYFD